VSGDVTPESERRVRGTLAALRGSQSPLILLLGGLLNLAQLLVLQGRLREAAASYEEVVQLTAGHEVLQVTTGGLAYYFGLGDLLREWNKLDEAEHCLTQGMELLKGTRAAFADNVALGFLALARLEQARGEYSRAKAALDTFTQRAQQEHYAAHLVTRGAAVRTQVELAEGNLAAAIRWMEESDLSPTDENLSYLREQEYLTLARVRIAQGRDDPEGPFLQEALSLLKRLQTAAESKARRGSVIEILILQALALDTQGERRAALSTLERVLVLTEPQGYMRLFIDEGPRWPSS
jgi:LuxR family maltose regulon positive regulatory protein